MKERQAKEESIGAASLVDYSFERPIKPEQLQILLRQTDWADDRTLDGIQRMLDATYLVLGAWEGDRLIGFVRTITDGIYRALVDDVIVEESRRRRGIGSERMQGLVKRLRELEIEEVFLRCGGGVAPFYKRHGFEKSHGVVMDLE